MKYSVYFPTPINEVNSLCDNIDVCIQMSNGQSYTVVIATPDGLKDIIKNEGVPYIRPCAPFLIVEEITERNIHMLIEELIKDDAAYLEVYGGDITASE